MKICVSSRGENLESQVDPRFGRCGYFIFVDTESMKFEAVRNEFAAAGGGAGIQSARLVADREAEAVLTGNCGPNAYNTLQAANITVYPGATGSIREAVDLFISGKMESTDGANVDSHFGMRG